MGPTEYGRREISGVRSRRPRRTVRLVAESPSRGRLVWLDDDFALDGAVGAALNGDGSRRLSRLLPCRDDRRRVEDVAVRRSRRCWTMSHVWNHEEADAFGSLCTAHRTHDRLVVAGGNRCWNRRVVPAAVHQQLAAAL